MDLEVQYSAEFDAGHQVEARERCRRQHGHHWKLTAAVRSRTGDAQDVDNLRSSVHFIVAEWHNRDLNEMLANFSETTPERLAPWVMERLLSIHSQMSLVEVSDSVVTARIRREPPVR